MRVRIHLFELVFVVSAVLAVKASTAECGVISISAGIDFTCAVSGSGALYCWGSGGHGDLGLGTTIIAPTPYAISSMSSGVTDVSLGHDQTACAVKNGAAYCWGRNTNGELGNNSLIDSNVPVPVYGLSSGVTQVSVGSSFACAVVTTSVYCWGDNTHGQIGVGYNYITEFLTPQLVSLPAGTPTHVSLASQSACVVMQNGATSSLYCWGGNGYGMLGLGDTTDRYTPSGPLVFSNGGVDYGSAVAQVSAGPGFFCAIATNYPFCWGANTSGQLGDGTHTQRTSPVPVSGLAPSYGLRLGDKLGGLLGSAAGMTRGVGISYVGLTWGSNQYGELGNNSTTDSSTFVGAQFPARVPQLPIGLLTAGGEHMCASYNGIPYCWGKNDSDECGSGSAGMPIYVPTAVGGTGITW